MPIANLCKMRRNTNYFLKGQKVWVVTSTGALAYQCLGRFRGKGRWILGWVHIDSANPKERYLTKPDARWIGEVEVSEEFYSYLIKIVGKIVKNEFIYHKGF